MPGSLYLRKQSQTNARLNVFPKGMELKLKALILLMRYSGIRISYAVMFRRNQVKNDKLFLRQAKTKHPVMVPLPKKVMEALKGCDEGDAYYFYNGIGKKKTCITEWQERLKKVYVLAGVKDGHSHRLRDTFAVKPARFRSSTGNRFDPARAKVDQDDGEALRAVGSDEAACS
jgi:integrase